MFDPTNPTTWTDADWAAAFAFGAEAIERATDEDLMMAASLWDAA